jgi:ABC-type multidrug transport system ATPase subunit
MSEARPVTARGLVKRYGDLVAVDHVDLTVEQGDVFGYLGPNGAGKTTSLRMLLGLIRPTEGSARLFGRDPLEDGAKALDGVAGFVEGPHFYPYLSGRRNLRLLADYDEPPVAGTDRRGARARRTPRPRQGQGRRLLPRHAAAARHRCGAPPRAAPAAP